MRMDSTSFYDHKLGIFFMHCVCCKRNYHWVWGISVQYEFILGNAVRVVAILVEVNPALPVEESFPVGYEVRALLVVDFRVPLQSVLYNTSVRRRRVDRDLSQKS